MMDLEIILGLLDKIMVLPLAIITFLILMYIGIYLLTKDPDIIRSRMFLKYHEIRKAILPVQPDIGSFPIIPNTM
jgi:hypothetical protein